MRLRALRAACAVAAAALAACSETGPKPAELRDFAATASPRVAWKASVGESETAVFVPAIADGDFFVAAADGVVRRLDARNGREKWKVDLRERLSGGVEARDGRVLVASAKGRVFALDLASGAVTWTTQVTSAVLAVPAIAEGIVVVRGADGRISGLDAKDGTRKWEYASTMPPLTLRTSGGVTIDSGNVYAGLAGGRVVALALATGAPLWEAVVAQPKGDTELERMIDVAGPPIVEDGQACAVAFQGRLACFDALKGTLAWARNASSVTPMAASDRSFYYVDDRAALHAADRSSGASLWKQDVLRDRGLGAPGVVGPYVVVGDFEGWLHFFDADEGTLRGRVRTDGSAITAAPIEVGDGNLVVQTREGHLYAITLR
ncbi:MAG: outer membrane protein assembly factor BamB [Burkholderiales bacterium]|nr:outer membrane protein assembly factor BamB [Burkholderiales bacterium]